MAHDPLDFISWGIRVPGVDISAIINEHLPPVEAASAHPVAVSTDDEPINNVEKFTFQTPEEFIGFGIRVPGVNINDLKNEQDTAIKATSDFAMTTDGEPVGLHNANMEKFTFETPEEFVGFGIRVPGVDINALKNELDSAIKATSESQRVTDQQLVAMTHGLHECPSFLSMILVILFCTGCLGSLLGFVHAGLRSTKCRQNVIFFHLFLANIGSILFIPFTVAARAYGFWYFQHEAFMALSFITSLSQVVVAFQLTLLATLRCKQILSNEEFPTTNCTMMVSFFIWIIALPIAALSILDTKILADTIKSDTFIQTSETGVLYVITFVFGSLIPMAIILFCIIYSYRKQATERDDEKIDCKIQRDIKELMMLGLLYIVCCLPVQIFRLLPRQRVDGCGMTLNILICAAALFSVLSPALHASYVSSSGRKSDELISTSKDSEVAVNVMKEIGERNGENDEEKPV